MKKRVLMVVIAAALVLCVTGTALASNTPAADKTQAAAAAQQGSGETVPMATASATSGTDSGSTATATPVPNESIWIDGTYIEDGMNMAYMNGYSPSVSGGVAKIVLPLAGVDTIQSGVVYCTLELGGDESPFVVANYENIPVYQKFSGINFFVARFSLPLKADRVNGVYPVTITVKYNDTGMEDYAGFTVNVRVTDGKDPNATEPPVEEEKPISQPKVIMSNYSVTPDPVYADETLTANVTLTNTSSETAVKNMTINYKSDTGDLIPAEGVTTAYVESIEPGGTKQFSFQMKATADAASGTQKIALTMEYEDTETNSYSTMDEIILQVKQLIRLEYDNPKFPSSVNVGDVVSNTLNLYNKGKNTLYNVTVILDMSGVIAQDGDVFIGTMEGGAAKSADVYADAGATMDANEVVTPGVVQGQYIVTYEDEYGEDYELVIPLETELYEAAPIEEDIYYEDDMDISDESAGVPWWVWLIIAAAGAAVAYVVVKKQQAKKREQELMEDLDDDDIL